MSTQVLQEFCVTVRRRSERPLSGAELKEIVEDYMKREVVVNGGVLGPLELEARYKMSFWDALVVHAAEAVGATVLYSEDLGGRVRLTAPFAL
jgi:predicted nucleic acid-binding protein